MKFYKLISNIFHPILVPMVGTILYFILLPRHTGRNLEVTIIGAVFIGSYLMPLIFLSFLKKSNVIKNFQLKSTEERKFPILFTIALLYLLASMIKKNGSTIDLALFFYGMQISLIITVALLYKKMKASLHMTGISGLLTFFILFSFYYQINILFILAFLFVISGLIASARINTDAHTKKEIFLGILIGVLGQAGIFIWAYNI